MALHVFVAMPYGHKQDIDFDAVYAEYLKPALEGAGFEVFRADEERRAGDIRADMFQELLLADLVVVDLTLDNPNVWYELGVRHALRARGVLLIQSERDFQPFDIYTERKLHYHLKDGRPDPQHLRGRSTISRQHGPGHHGILARASDQPGIPVARRTQRAGLAQLAADG